MAAVAMMEQINAACTDAILEWGRAVNKAEKAPEGPVKEAATTLAKLCGMRALELATGLARKLP